MLRTLWLVLIFWKFNGGHLQYWELKSEDPGLSDCNEIPELTAVGDRVRMGDTVTMHCSSRNGLFPINYILFHKQTIKGIRMESTERNVSFNVTIVDHTHLGPYKCRANCSTYFVYSKAFNFALQGGATNRSAPPDVRIGMESASPWLVLCLRLLLFVNFVFLTLVIVMAWHRKGSWKVCGSHAG
ncbi:allergin-1-like isoform X2 [Hyperolius riggenbachi]|uniref:allergin-1-like isoform X2 n=1 Tax=Hyperolius riggenbachi TaxID=752182 RepID=UPI0035A319AC